MLGRLKQAGQNQLHEQQLNENVTLHLVFKLPMKNSLPQIIKKM